MKYNDRQKDILDAIKSLDITPTMFKNANDKYHNIAKFLSENGLEAEFYPQGSFACGTVVRPNIKDANASYDLDAVCQVKALKETLSAKDLFEKLVEVFKSNAVYKERMKVYDKCITIQYADVGEVGFSIDIIPAVEETEEIKNEQRMKSERPDLVDTAIAIPKHCKKNYVWFTNNPKGFKKWFEEKNTPFLQYIDEYRASLFEANRALFATVEEIPEGLNRTAMQRVIQILKRNRDVFYQTLEKADNKLKADDIKPISAIINIIVAEICKDAPAYYSVFDLLEYVLEQLDIYSFYQGHTEAEFNKRYSKKKVIQKVNGLWNIKNPALGKDNLADSWNENHLIPKYFFIWVQAARKDIITSLTLTDDAEFRSCIDNAFGYEVVQKVLGNKYYEVKTPEVIRNVGARPWRA